MDPTVCLRDILARVYMQDREAVLEGLQNLTAWIDNGGFLPTVELLGPADLRHPDPVRIRVAV
jgi:hypothetical protein